VQHVSVAADGMRAVSVSKNGQLVVWHLPTGECEIRFTVDECKRNPGYAG